MTDGGSLLLGFCVLSVCLGAFVHCFDPGDLGEDIGLGFLLTGALAIYGYIVVSAGAALFETLLGFLL